VGGAGGGEKKCKRKHQDNFNLKKPNKKKVCYSLSSSSKSLERKERFNEPATRFLNKLSTPFEHACHELIIIPPYSPSPLKLLEINPSR